jgi:hypothetical protein
MAPPAKVAVVTTAWGQADDERQLVLRQIASALALGSSEPVVLRLGSTPETRMDGAFRVVGVGGAPPQRRRSRLLERSLAGEEGEMLRDAPDVIGEELRRLAGGWNDQVPGYLDELGATHVVLAGYRSAVITHVLASRAPERRHVLVPLAGADPFVSLRTFDSAFSSADAVLTVTPGEDQRVRARPGGAARSHMVGFPLEVDPLAWETEPPGLEAEDFTLVLAQSHGRRSGLESLGRYLHDRLSHRPVVLVGDDHMLVGKGRAWNKRPAPSKRIDLGRVMARARVTVDLRRPELLAREVLESLLLGTPVIVRDGSPGHDHAERGDCGLWWRDPLELVECVRVLEHSAVRDRLGERGREYAERLFSDVDGFVQRVRQVA